MTTETEEGKDDLRSLLSASFEQHEQREQAPADKSNKTVKPAAADATEGDGTEKDGAVAVRDGDRNESGAKSSATGRAADGKFKKTAAADGDETALPSDSKTKPEGGEEKSAEAPARWSAAEKQEFAKLPTEAQKLLLDRYKSMEADHTKKTMAIARLKDLEPVDKMFEPYRDIMRQKGLSIVKVIEGWANVERKLSQGEAAAIEQIAALARAYKVTPAKLAAAIGIGPAAQNGVTDPAATVQAAAAATQYPPELLAKLDALERQVGGLTASERANAQREQTTRESRVTNEIETFKSAKDGHGNPLHPHFEDVEDDMVLLATGYASRQQQIPPLQELYDRAVNANPSTREKLRAAEKQLSEQTAKDEARAKAAAAKKASASVTGSPAGAGPSPGGGRVRELSLREQLEEAAREQAQA